MNRTPWEHTHTLEVDRPSLGQQLSEMVRSHIKVMKQEGGYFTKEEWEDGLPAVAITMLSGVRLQADRGAHSCNVISNEKGLSATRIASSLGMERELKQILRAISARIRKTPARSEAWHALGDMREELKTVKHREEE